MNLQQLLAQTTQPSSQPPPPLFEFLRGFGPIIIILLIFYFFIFGSRRKQERQRQQMLNQLKKGDRVQTIGGILGTVVETRDNEVLLKVDESSNTKIRFSRSAIHRVIEEEKSDIK